MVDHLLMAANLIFTSHSPIFTFVDLVGVRVYAYVDGCVCACACVRSCARASARFCERGSVYTLKSLRVFFLRLIQRYTNFV